MLLVGGRQQTESYWPAAAAAAAKASAPPSLQHNHADVSSICISIVGHHLKRARKRFSCKTHDLPNYELHSNPLFKKAPSSPFVFGLTCCIEERPTDRRPTDHPTSQDLKLASNATSVLRPRLYWPHAHIVTLNVSPVGLHDDSIPPVSLFGLSTGSATGTIGRHPHYHCHAFVEDLESVSNAVGFVHFSSAMSRGSGL